MKPISPQKEWPVFNQILKLLQESGLNFHLHAHTEVCTIEQARQRVPHLTRHLIKTIVFQIKNGRWVLAAVDKDCRIDYKKLADALGTKRTALRSIAPDQVTKALGFQVGGVGPFPVRDEIQVVADVQLQGIGSVFCGSGINTQTIEMDMDDLIALSRAVVAPITKPPT